jgi:glucose-1-phosphate thymidylyltransferase
MIEKGIILAGGESTRLYPSTLCMSKQLLPVYDKPMVYYPLCTLMQAGITRVLLIARPEERSHFQTLLGDGSQWGLSIEYGEQITPSGIAEALLIGESFIAGEPVALVLGDNIFHGPGFPDLLARAASLERGAALFGYPVDHPDQFGVIEVDGRGNAVSLEEKPAHPRSSYAVPGLYFYDGRVVEIARGQQPSVRGELEITDVNRVYLEAGELQATLIGPEITWFDAGTADALLAASNYVADTERREGGLVACPEEIAWRRGLIERDQFARMAKTQKNSDYGRYLARLLD